MLSVPRPADPRIYPSWFTPIEPGIRGIAWTTREGHRLRLNRAGLHFVDHAAGEALAFPAAIETATCECLEVYRILVLNTNPVAMLLPSLPWGVATWILRELGEVMRRTLASAGLRVHVLQHGTASVGVAASPAGKVGASSVALLYLDAIHGWFQPAGSVQRLPLSAAYWVFSADPTPHCHLCGTQDLRDPHLTDAPHLARFQTALDQLQQQPYRLFTPYATGS